MRLRSKVRELITALLDNMHKWRKLVVVFSCIVVLAVTYLLIVPASALEKEVAAEQGGIDVPAVSKEANEENTAEAGVPAEDDPEKALEKEPEGDPLTYEGDGYSVTVNDTSSVLPDDASVSVEEITSDTDTEKFDELYKQAEAAIADEAGEAGSKTTIDYVRFYDISLAADGTEIEPERSVSVIIEYEKKLRRELSVDDPQNVRIVHYKKDPETGEVETELLDSEEIGLAVETENDRMSAASFEAESFSVYGIVKTSEEPVKYVDTASDLSELTSTQAESGFYLSVTRGSTTENYYFTSNVIVSNNKGVLEETQDKTQGAIWFFEPVEGAANQFKIYTYVNNEKKYIKQVTAGNAQITLAETGDAFEISLAAEGKFYFKLASENLWLQHSNGGGGIRLYRDPGNAGNSNITLTFVDYKDPGADPYHLGGNSYGIAYNDETITAAALMGEAANAQRLKGEDLLIREDVLEHKGVLLVSSESDITEWTFENIEEDKYYIRTGTEDSPEYLTIDGNNLTLTDTPDPAKSVIKATPGTGENAGKWMFSSNGRMLMFTGSAANGFGATNKANEKVWFNLLEKSDKLDNNDFVSYTARKVSVSDDTQVYDKTDESTGERKQSQVIIYTRIWNEETKRYDTYAVDHDGTLFKVYPSGDLIQWVGSDAKSAIWEFTEYHNDDGTPNYYYELKNAGYGNYIAPRLAGGQISSDEALGINLPGRRNGIDYSTIVAWDDEHYEFAGLKIGEDGKVVPCPIEEAVTFHFAVLTEEHTDDPTEELTKVDTIDNEKFGIKMKMIDFNNSKPGNRDSRQTEFFGHDTDEKGLLSSQLGEDGYPTASKAGDRSLKELFSPEDPEIMEKNPTTDVNHLFIESIYNESGYFEYDSTQNFAHLESEGENKGNFIVYDQLAQIGTSTWPTRTHGQFMPYNDIVPGYVSETITNQTDVTGNPLPETDPRQGEKLYHIPDNRADYFFGMEMEASFTQTADGLDDWGHDIIFEFSGDDDFWLYVDGKLVLDLGGVHSASSGSINFRTGEVTMVRRKYDGRNMHVETDPPTTLRDVFAARGLSEAELDEIFELKNVDGVDRYVFKDFSSHTMKMFYMERGSGASNLHMRFNLASVKPGTALLSKKVSGVKSQSNSLTEYPFQIRYLVQEFKEEGVPSLDVDGNPVKTEHVLSNVDEDEEHEKVVRAYYAGTTKEVSFRSEFTTSDDVTYENVYLLKAGETAELVFPEHTTHYAVVECGVDPDVYQAVKVGDDEEVVSGKIAPVASPTEPSSEYVDKMPVTEGEYAVSAKKDYGIGYAELNKRPEAAFDNQLDPGAVSSLEITKELYDTGGQTRLHYDLREGDAEDSEDKSVFNFRLYLGSEYDDEGELPAANMYLYHVKNRDGVYCRWSAIDQEFVSLGDGKDDFNELTEEEKKAATFKTSIYGAISRIPSDYTVEVPDLVVNTKFKVEERTNEIPRGYTLRSGDGYRRTDEGHEENYETTPVSGVIKAKKDPETGTTEIETPKVLISNQKGWGLTAEKIWTDKDFVESRDDIFLAVYVKTGEGSGEGSYTLDPETVRRLRSKETEAYYFFDDLYFEGIYRNFDDFVVREVKVAVREDSGKTLEELIDNKGHVMISETVGEGDAAVVKTYADVTPIAQDETVIVPGVKKGESDKTPFEYTVLYKQGEPTGRNENVRVDKVINSRPGIILYKTDWAGQWKVDDGTGTVTGALSGAGFSITDEDGRNIAAETYMSGDDGLVTVVYLDEGEYTLTETKSPKGYVGLEKPVTVSVDENNRVTVSGSAAGTYCTTHNPEGSETYVTDETYGKMFAAVTVRNRPVSLTAKKVDASGNAVGGAHFALFRQINTSDGGVRKDFDPIKGYEDIVSEQDGILPGIDMDLRAGTYYLQEIEAPEGYELLKSDLKFTIGSNGTVTIDEAVNGTSILSFTDAETGRKTWTIRVLNGKTAKVSFKKIDIVKAGGQDVPLGGAEFDLYTTEGGEIGEKIYEGLISRDEDGLLTYGTDGEITVFELGDGEYRLIETMAPEGYIRKESPVIVYISDDGATVTYDEGTALSGSGDGITVDEGVHTLSITNTAGIELPHTGGPGTAIFYIVGAVLTFGCAVMLISRRCIQNTK